MKYTLLFFLVLLLSGCGDDAKDGAGSADSDSDSNNDSDSSNGSDSSNDSDSSSDGIDSNSDENEHDTNLDDCVDINWDVDLKSVNILVLLDRSKSMYDWHMPADGTDTYAMVVQQALEYIVEQNTNAGTINFALNAFPSHSTCPDASDDDALSLADQCAPASQYFSGTPETSAPPQVAFNRNTGGELEVSAQTLTLIQNQLDALNQCGGTPIALSLEWALYYLQTEEMPADDTYIILATDGAPNCNSNLDEASCRFTSSDAFPIAEFCLDDMAAYEAAKALRAAGYKTFVIGVGDAAQDDADIFNEVMNGLAYYGATVSPADTVPDSSTPFYFSAANPETLDAALEEITNEVIDCEYAVDWLSVPDEFDGNAVNKNCSDVRIFGVDRTTGLESEVGYTQNCSLIADGALAWYWKETPNATFEEIESIGNDYTQCANIQLCPTACTRLKAIDGEPAAWSSVSAKFGCQPKVVPIIPE